MEENSLIRPELENGQEEKLENSLDKIRAIVLIEIKVLVKYEDFMTIVLREIWGTGPRSTLCKKYVYDYIQLIEQIVEEGINKKEILDGDKNVIASGIFGFTCSSLIYKMRRKEEINITDLYSEIEKTFIRKLKR